jgi:predicted nucleotidyltransferase
MKSDDAIAILRRHADDLRARGVQHVALFGSVARGEAGPDSDIDVMIELDPARPIGVFEYVGLKRYIEELFGRRVDVVNRHGLKPHVRGSATADACTTSTTTSRW